MSLKGGWPEMSLKGGWPELSFELWLAKNLQTAVAVEMLLHDES